jgi:uncharacterized protein YutE (UPF0331/DUF86 family)
VRNGEIQSCNKYYTYASKDHLVFVEGMNVSIDKILKQLMGDQVFWPMTWKQMYGLRNFAVHEYHIIDSTIFWEIAENYLVENKIQLEALLEAEKYL